MKAAFKCPGCHRVSYNPNDVTHRYCGACHRFWDDRAAAEERIKQRGGRVVSDFKTIVLDTIRCRLEDLADEWRVLQTGYISEPIEIDHLARVNELENLRELLEAVPP